ncbi:MAG: cobaltochelatase subunit CobN, partial [Candidatus Amulumruptor sp.]|nr:cobaltochelatase subunit CobN [Candidatus Amulumruptor sp.]
NVPLFSPVTANRAYDEWRADKMGMHGGFLSQSIVTPEIDGAIRTFTLFAHFTGDAGLPYLDAIPDRLTDFVATVNNHIALRRKPEADKKIAIFYFKGPGQNALVAEGMEVAPSLFNLLTRLKAEGYTVTGLPADAAALEKLINENGKVFNNYATGARADFVNTRNPQTVTRADYDRWCDLSFSREMRADIDAVDGEFPGHGLSDGNGNIALARLQFGNIVLIPQTAAGLGDDDFKIVHGTDAAPPHSYVAAYLWARHGFGADALMHFGAHGSLEFTPRKQAALGSDDWPDRLVGPMPHVYVYATSNVGEAMMAKRRSYGTIVNYLTPPFIESNVRGIYKNLTDAIADYNRARTPADTLRAGRLVRKYTVELGIHRELRIDSAKPFTPDDIIRVETFADELANEKITGAYYVMGIPYSDEHIRSTVEAMTIDPIAFSLAKLKGGDAKRYRDEARHLVASRPTIDDAAVCRIAGITQADLDSARHIRQTIEGSKDMLSRMMVMGAMMSSPKQTVARIADRASQAPSR